MTTELPSRGTANATPEAPAEAAVPAQVAATSTTTTAVDPAPPTMLWHYTRWDALHGMMVNRELWLSNFYFLNDFNEGVILPMRIREMQGDFHDQMRPQILKAVDTIKRELYLLSLSERDDSLTQWLSYASPGPGFAIGFDTERLLAIDLGMRVVRCVYDKADQVAMVRDYFRGYTTAWIAQNEPPPGDKNIRFWMNKNKQVWDRFLLGGYINLSQRLKSHEFSDEKEWRFTTGQNGEAGKQIHFRSNGAFVVPYIKLGLDPDPGKFPIRKILVRPSANIEVIVDGVQRMCQAHGLKDIEVVKSKVALRE